MLAAARAEFAAAGYGGATTREIAARADVSEAVLFRHFASKSVLFEAAVAEPLDEFLAGFAARWSGTALPAGSPAEIMRQFTEALYAIVEENRDLFSALASNRIAGRGLQTALARLDDFGAALAAEHGLTYDTPVAVRGAFLLVVNAALYEDVVFVGDAAVGRARIIDELTRILTAAMIYRG
jgi:AcrR family transcriptional regulator